ncbi:MAG: hypothetical protein HYX60_09500 [Legionella longbeachae]|nr:hypothetical protein [Legionella longbeachae]
MPTKRQQLFNLLNSQAYLKQFSPEAKQTILDEYHDSIGLAEDLTFGATAFEDHAKKRINGLDGFKKQMGPEKTDTLDKLLKGDDPEVKKEVRTTLNELFKAQPFYENAKINYAETIEAFKDKVKEVPEKYTVEDIRSELNRVQGSAKNAIKAQQKMEKTNLNKLFDDESFMEKFKEALGNTDSDQVKKDLIAELNKSHEEQLAAFEKTAAENITHLDQAAAKEMERLILSFQLDRIAEQLTGSNKDLMEKEIERAREENLKKRKITREDENTEAFVNTRDGTISTLNPDDLNFIISLTGQKINHDKANGLWTVNLSNRIASPFYYASFQSCPKTDMLTMAQLVRASGFERITMIVNFDDESTRKQRAREAYEACLESGFEPDKIKLVDGNNKEIKPEEIFTPGELQRLKQNAGVTRDELKQLKEKAPKSEPNQDRVNTMREELLELRNKKRADSEKITKESLKQDEQEIKTVLDKP